MNKIVMFVIVLFFVSCTDTDKNKIVDLEKRGCQKFCVNGIFHSFYIAA